MHIPSHVVIPSRSHDTLKGPTLGRAGGLGLHGFVCTKYLAVLLFRSEEDMVCNAITTNVSCPIYVIRIIPRVALFS